MSQSNIYDMVKITSEAQRLEMRVKEIFKDGIKPKLTPEE